MNILFVALALTLLGPTDSWVQSEPIPYNMNMEAGIDLKAIEIYAGANQQGISLEELTFNDMQYYAGATMQFFWLELDMIYNIVEGETFGEGRFDFTIRFDTRLGY